MVDEINMAKWIVALRSGKYTQGHGRLRDGVGQMCCLGVLCEISGLGEWKNLVGIGPAFESAEDVLTEVPPIDVAAWLFPVTADSSMSIRKNNPRIRNPETGEEIECADANDNHEWDFTKIANALESTYLPGKKAEEILAGAK